MAKKAGNTSQKQNAPAAYLIFAALAGIITYGFVSWAIDSGSWWHYLFTFISLYYTVHFIKEFISRLFTNNDKKAKTRRS